MAKLTAWPNKMGSTFKAIDGVWELLDNTTIDGFWHANFFAKGEYFASKYGKGKTYKEAILTAQHCQS